jgi:hypothetical protein
MKRLCSAIAGLLLLIANGASEATATGDCVLPDMRTDQRPDPDGVPTPIKIGVLVADITAVDDVNQAIEGDFFLRMQWRDPRLAGVAGCRIPKSSVWFPRVELLNSNQLTSRRRFAFDQVRVQEDGLVVYLQRNFGRIATYHDLSRFPFDSHEFELRMADFDYTSHEIQLVFDPEFTTLAQRLNIPDWKIIGVSGKVDDRFLDELDKSLSIFTLFIKASRNPGYYILKVLVPLTLIVMMSWVVFWINPEKFGPQIGISATSMLTLIAFQFALSAVLPKLSYFTVMDRLILGATVLVFLSLVEATVTAVLVTRDKKELALRIDATCRWLFPSALLVWWGAILAWA